MDAVSLDGFTMMAQKTYEEIPSFAVFRAHDGKTIAVGAVAFGKLTKCVGVAVDDVPELIVALRQAALGGQCGPSPTGDATNAGVDLTDPLRAFECGLAKIAHKISSTLFHESHANHQHPESLVDELLLDLRPQLRATFAALIRALQPGVVPQS